MHNYREELNNIFKKYKDKEKILEIKDTIKNVEKTLTEDVIKKRKPIVILYNVHKRSLPPEINKCILYNLTEEEANWWISTKLKPKLVEYIEDGPRKVIYYDKVRTDGWKAGIFDNNVPIVKNEEEI